MVSFIIPVYNAENTVRRCVESILRLRSVEVQVILVEDHSLDCSYAECKKLEIEDARVEVYCNDKKGVSSARNLGLSKVKGDIVGFADADDYLDSVELERALKCFDDRNIDIVFTGINRCIGDKVYKRKIKKTGIISSSKAIEYILCEPATMGSVCNKFYRADFVCDIQFPMELEYYEDGFFNISVLSKNRDLVVYASEFILYFYVYNETSSTNEIDNIFDNDGILKYVSALDYIETKISLTTNEKNYLIDKKIRVSIENISNAKKIENEIALKKILNTVRECLGKYTIRIFRFDILYRIKLLVWGMFNLLSER